MRHFVLVIRRSGKNGLWSALVSIEFRFMLQMEERERERERVALVLDDEIGYEGRPFCGYRITNA
jgi:hypothetical protein